MAISNQNTKYVYLCNGSNRIWQYDFPLVNKADLEIYQTDPQGVQTRVDGSFVVDEDLSAVIYPIEESELPPLPAGYKITVLRRTPLTQPITLSANGILDAKTLEEGYDRCVMQTQELNEKLGRALLFCESDTETTTDAAAYLREITQTKNSAVSEITAFKDETLSAVDELTSAAIVAADTANESAQESIGLASQAAASAARACEQAEEALASLQDCANRSEAAQAGALAAQQGAEEKAASCASAAETVSQLAQTVQEQVQSAQESCASALQSASEAAASQTQSQEYQTQAAESAQAASEQAQTAVQEASRAEQQADRAETYANRASGRAMGEVYYSQSGLAADNPGGLPGWTGEYVAEGAVLYPDFYAWVKNHSELCIIRADYDARLAQYGECPFYVVDEAEGSLRLPKLTHFIKNAGADGIGQKEAGLPNIDGKVPGAAGIFAGAFTQQNSTGGVSPGSFGQYQAHFSAEKSNPIYGKSDTVRPAHTTLYPWIYAFTAAVPASTAQAAQFTGALMSKANADLSNVSGNQLGFFTTLTKSADGNKWAIEYFSDAAKANRVFCEQGVYMESATGNTGTVTLLRPMSNVKWAAVVGQREVTSAVAGRVVVEGKTTTTFNNPYAAEVSYPASILIKGE